LPETLRQYKASIFQALAHPTRIAILELLKDGELPVSVILDRLALEPANGSQHLAVLRTKQIVVSRKEGNQVFYTLRDPRLIQVMEIMRAYCEAHVQDSLILLNEATL